MRVEHIKEMLQISFNFNTSSISHSFTIGERDMLVVKCIKGTFILEIKSSENQQVEYYLTTEQAALAIHKRIHSDNLN